MARRPHRPGGGGPDPDLFVARFRRPSRCAACLLPPEQRAALDDWLRRYPSRLKLALVYLRAPVSEAGCGFSGEALDRVTQPVLAHHREYGHHEQT